MTEFRSIPDGDQWTTQRYTDDGILAGSVLIARHDNHAHPQPSFNFTAKQLADMCGASLAETTPGAEPFDPDNNEPF